MGDTKYPRDSMKVPPLEEKRVKESGGVEDNHHHQDTFLALDL